MTREHMGETIDAIGDRVSPRRIVERRRNRMRATYWAARDAVMGRSGNAASSIGQRASNTGTSISEGASHLADRMTDLPSEATRQTQGSPLGAGLVAFGAGLVLAAVIPPTEPEKQAAAKVKDAAEPLVEDAKEMGKELASTLQADGRDAGGALKETAQHAVDTVTEKATSAAQQTREAGAEAVHDLRDQPPGAGPAPTASPAAPRPPAT
jgi:hypothetical protein